MFEEKEIKVLEEKAEALLKSTSRVNSMKKALEEVTLISKKLDDASIVDPSKLDQPITI